MLYDNKKVSTGSFNNVTFNYITSKGKKIAKPKMGFKLVFPLIFGFILIVFAFVFITELINYGELDITPVGILIFVVLFSVTLFSISYRKRIVLETTKNIVYYEKTIFGIKLSGDECGYIGNLESKLDKNNDSDSTLNNKESYYLSIRNNQSNEYTDIIGNQPITLEEAEKLSNFLRIKLIKPEQKSISELVENNVTLEDKNVPKVSGLAIASFVVGIASVFLFFIGVISGLIAIGLGVAALVEIKKNKNKTGKVFAIIGIISGTLVVLAIIAIFVLLMSLPAV